MAFGGGQVLKIEKAGNISIDCYIHVDQSIKDVPKRAVPGPKTLRGFKEFSFI
jgi:hypothetical protein